MKLKVLVNLFYIGFIVNKIEEKIGLDLNRDGRIGGPGLTDQIEKKTHIDLNRDGVVGVHRPPPGGGKIKQTSNCNFIIFLIIRFSW